jgi:hypothetical protein
VAGAEGVSARLSAPLAPGSRAETDGPTTTKPGDDEPRLTSGPCASPVPAATAAPSAPTPEELSPPLAAATSVGAPSAADGAGAMGAEADAAPVAT